MAKIGDPDWRAGEMRTSRNLGCAQNPHAMISPSESPRWRASLDPSHKLSQLLDIDSALQPPAIPHAQDIIDVAASDPHVNNGIRHCAGHLHALQAFEKYIPIESSPMVLREDAGRLIGNCTDGLTCQALLQFLGGPQGHPEPLGRRSQEVLQRRERQSVDPGGRAGGVEGRSPFQRGQPPVVEPAPPGLGQP